ncbi:MAG: sigma-70 family RNA polymerase sigma factor [Myxococcota bacterium]|nr:sigma-70 family RNA polymerase sigma factor [Myxococcales bacterium]
MAVAVYTTLADESDEALVAIAQRELPAPCEAFDVLVARHRARVERRAAAIVGSRADAEDVAQEVFLSVFRALPRYRPVQPFAHWLERIVTNSCRMHLRARRRHDRRVAAVASDWRARKPIDVRPDVRRDALFLCGRLSDVNRRAFVLRTADDAPYREIADELGISESAAKMRVRRARAEAERLAVAQRGEWTAAPA